MCSLKDHCEFYVRMDCRETREETEKPVGGHSCPGLGRGEGDVEDGGDGSRVFRVFQSDPSLLQPIAYHSGSHTVVFSKPLLNFPGIPL